jgi:hypothetical protein
MSSVSRDIINPLHKMNTSDCVRNTMISETFGCSSYATFQVLLVKRRRPSITYTKITLAIVTSSIKRYQSLRVHPGECKADSISLSWWPRLWIIFRVFSYYLLSIFISFVEVEDASNADFILLVGRMHTISFLVVSFKIEEAIPSSFFPLLRRILLLFLIRIQTANPFNLCILPMPKEDCALLQ